MSELKQKEADEIVKKISNLFETSNFDQLKEYILKIIKKYPNWDFPYSALGISLVRNNNISDAEKYFTKAVNINPTTKNLNNLGAFYKDTKNFKEAKRYFTRVTKKDNKFKDGFYNLGLVFFELKEFDNAVESLNFALKLDNKNAQYHLALGNALRENKDYHNARERYDIALSLDKTLLSALNARAILSSLELKKDEALEDIKASLSLGGDNSEAYFVRAGIYLRISEFNKALSDYKKCLDLDNRYIRANYGIANVYKNKGFIKKSISYFKKELEINPTDHHALFMIGDSYIMLGDFKSSLIYLEEAIRLDPTNPDYNTILAVQKKINGEYKEAASLFKKGELERWRENELNCLYLAKTDLDKFYSKLDEYSLVAQESPLIASIYYHANTNFGITNNYNFCDDPINYIYQNNIGNIVKNSDQLIQEVIKNIDDLEVDKVGQLLLENGEQSAGDIFSLDNKIFDEIHRIISNEIVIYREKYKDSNSKFIQKWPKDYELKGWYIKMQKNGNLKRHMHEDGWLSGTFYINMPEIRNNEGMIEFSLFCEQYLMNEEANLDTKILNLEKGDLILFPSSLYHRTIPFSSTKERICIAFDIKPIIYN